MHLREGSQSRTVAHTDVVRHPHADSLINIHPDRTGVESVVRACGRGNAIDSLTATAGGAAARASFSFFRFRAAPVFFFFLLPFAFRFFLPDASVAVVALATAVAGLTLGGI